MNHTQQHIAVHRRAVIAMDALSRSERNQLLEALEALRSLPLEQWDSHGASRLSPDEPVYVLSVTEHLLAFFSVPTAGEILIEDLVRPETLRNLGLVETDATEAT